MLWQEWVEKVARPLFERLEPQCPRVAAMQSLEEPPRVQAPRPKLLELPEEASSPLWEQVELAQPWSPLQRVGDRLLADPLVAAPPARQWPLQQAEVSLPEVVDPWLQKFAPPLQLERPLPVWQQPLPPARHPEQVMLQRRCPWLAVELP